MSDDYELDFLLSLDGMEFDFTGVYRVRISAKPVIANKGRPAGVKYSLTLHDTNGARLYGIDNAHGIKGGLTFDHWHIYDTNETRPYHYTGAAKLMGDFYREVERILKERGIR